MENGWIQGVRVERCARGELGEGALCVRGGESASEMSGFKG
jgi:hypothetical protein